MTPATARLLLVEDDQTLSEIVSTLLKQEAYRVTLTRNGEDALRLAREERPDLILLDVLLPKMSGFEVCQRLRSDPATCLIPIILVTALGATKDKVTGFKLGADEYLSKPFESMELLARVERVLQRSREELAANPLTGLPGGVALEREIQRRLMDQEAFTVARADVSGLATFNRLYGYEKGDHVVRLIGMILRSAVVELGNNNDLVAHFGGDDFGFVSTSVRAEVVAARALENAETLLLMQYEEKDRTPPPRGPAPALMTLSIGIVDVAPGRFHHHVPVLDEAAAALAEAKKINGHHLIRRDAVPV
ncbi:MAG TPA: response regulator [Elusimicrobiota bacterium]|jgi:diguanylate cyclase (GGDEF)-like protein|nr:response regulator [Elusimicrobiota bacterium]HMU96039.1 response regulator [Elusimicrobiota bacterium]HMX42230.1 response regulator [Elusimicrobiota bacterium]HMX94124.1 response regulator [Elusimicrobiota bacterium]HNC75025.1 response regulator [Elusimicrobiota bacterium]